ncbi:Glutamate receptor 2.5 [Senna tora]|uniref:Glutamate receptor 2.5 n=1 Tax=Senna tora TaxID=362788 RepID=A0A834TF49_9FABA|nr:Glutamate receptor 2.5 [Senna tora]
MEVHAIIGVFTQFVSVTYDSIRNQTSITGFSIDVFKAAVNFLPYPLPYVFVPFNGSYDDMVEQVYKKKLDAAVGDIEIMAYRSQYVMFSQPYIESGLEMVVATKPTKSKERWMFMRAFTMEMWLMMVAMHIFIGIFIWLMERQVNEELRGLGDMLWFSVTVLLFAHRDSIRHPLARIVLGPWLFVILIVTTSFTTNLTSMMMNTTSQLEPSVIDIETLQRTNASVGCNGNSFIVKYLIEVLRFKPENIKRMNSMDDYHTAFKQRDIEAAFFVGPHANVFLAKYSCTGYYIKAGNTIRLGGFGFVFPKGSPLGGDISEALLKVIESGETHQLEKNMLSTISCSSSKNKSDQQEDGALAMDHTQSMQVHVILRTTTLDEATIAATEFDNAMNILILPAIMSIESPSIRFPYKFIQFDIHIVFHIRRMASSSIVWELGMRKPTAIYEHNINGYGFPSNQRILAVISYSIRLVGSEIGEHLAFPSLSSQSNSEFRIGKEVSELKIGNSSIRLLLLIVQSSLEMETKVETSITGFSVKGMRYHYHLPYEFVSSYYSHDEMVEQVYDKKLDAAVGDVDIMAYRYDETQNETSITGFSIDVFKAAIKSLPYVFVSLDCSYDEMVGQGLAFYLLYAESDNKMQVTAKPFKPGGLGFSIDVFKAAVNCLTYPLPYVFVPFNGSYDEMVEQVHKKKLDAAVGDLEIMAYRSQYVMFSLPYIESGLDMAVATKPIKSKEIWMFTRAFTIEMWLMMVAMHIFIGIFIWLMERQGNEELRGLGAMLWFLVTALFFTDRGSIRHPLARIVLGLWLFVILIVTTTFTASLTSMMMTMRLLQPSALDIETLQRTNAPVNGNSFIVKYLVEVLKFKPENIKRINSMDDYHTAFKNRDVEAAFFVTPHANVFLAKYSSSGYIKAGNTIKLGGFGFKLDAAIGDVDIMAYRYDETQNETSITGFPFDVFKAAVKSLPYVFVSFDASYDEMVGEGLAFYLLYAESDNKMQVAAKPFKPGGLGTVNWSGGHNIEIKIGVPTKGVFTQFVNVTYDENRNETSITGFSIDVFKAAVNCLPYPLPYVFVPFNGSNDELVEQVHKKKLDAAVGDIEIMAYRSQYVMFSQPYIESGLDMVVATKPNKSKEIWIFTRAFTIEMWLMMVAMHIFIGIFIWLMERQVNEELRGLGNMLWFLVTVLFLAHRESIRHPLARIVLGPWLFVILIVTTSFTTNLTSMMMTTRQLEPSVLDIETLQRTNAPVGCNGNSFIVKYLVEVLRFKPENIKRINSMDDYHTAFKNRDIEAAFFVSPHANVFLAKYSCTGYMKAGNTIKLGGFGFVFPKGSPLGGDISEALLKVIESGETHQLEKNMLSTISCSSSKSKTQQEDGPLGVEPFLGIFSISATIAVLTWLYSIKDLVVSNLPNLMTHIQARLTQFRILWGWIRAVFMFGNCNLPL